jgi:hypothetical protein
MKSALSVQNNVAVNTNCALCVSGRDLIICSLFISGLEFGGTSGFFSQNVQLKIYPI